jgi:hypothetical protein
MEQRFWKNSCERILVHYLTEVYGLGVVSFICDLREVLAGFYHVLFMPAGRMNEAVDQYLTSAGLDLRYLDRPLRPADLTAVRADAAILWDAGQEEFNTLLSEPVPAVKLSYRYYLPASDPATLEKVVQFPPECDRQSFPPAVSEAMLFRGYRRVNRGRTVIGLLAGRASPAYCKLAAETIRRLDRRRFIPLVMQYEPRFVTADYTAALNEGLAQKNIIVCPYRLGAVREALRYTSLVVADDFRVQAEAGLLAQPVLTGLQTYEELEQQLDRLTKDRRQLEQLAGSSRLLGSRRALELTIPRLEALL